jgi:hypothetical protein
MRDKFFFRDDIKRQDIDILKRRLRAKMGGYTVAIRDLPAGTLLYRGVRCDQLPITIDRISYPPSAVVMTLGRLNRAGASMFYCTLGEPPVIYELKARRGDRIALSEWETTESLWIHGLGYHDDAFRQKRLLMGPRHQLNMPIPNESRFNGELRRKFSLALAEDVQQGDEYKYKLTVAINELLFDEAEPIPNHPGGPRYDRPAGTAYPSMQVRGRADNVALFPAFVDSSLRIRSVKYLIVDSVDQKHADYAGRTLKTATSFDGNLILWDSGGAQRPWAFKLPENSDSVR